MRVCHYTGAEDVVTTGISSSITQQRKALASAGVPHTTDPTVDYDVLHVNLPDPISMWQVRRARRSGLPVVMHAHVTHDDFRDSFRFSNALRHPLRRYLAWAYGLADVLVCPTSYAESIVSEHYSDATVVISNGVDTDRLEGFEDRRDDARDHFDMSRTSVFTVGLVFQRKGLSTFVDVARARDEFDFFWFGKRLNRLITQHGTHRLVANSPSNVSYTGYVDDIRDAYAAGDVFFFPTQVENQGIPALEAAYCDRPLVLSDHPVFADDFEHEFNCLKANSRKGFGEQIERLVNDRALRDRLVANARETTERHTLDTVGDRLRGVYEDLIDRKASH